MATFFTARQRALMDLPERAEVHVPTAELPPRCCDAAQVEHCTCEAVRWKCPVHGRTGQPCTRLTHD